MLKKWKIIYRNWSEYPFLIFYIKYSYTCDLIFYFLISMFFRLILWCTILNIPLMFALLSLLITIILGKISHHSNVRDYLLECIKYIKTNIINIENYTNKNRHNLHSLMFVKRLLGCTDILFGKDIANKFVYDNLGRIGLDNSDFFDKIYSGKLNECFVEYKDDLDSIKKSNRTNQALRLSIWVLETEIMAGFIRDLNNRINIFHELNDKEVQKKLFQEKEVHKSYKNKLHPKTNTKLN